MIEPQFFFEINHDQDEEILKISFFLPAFLQHSQSEIDMVEFKFTTGVYIDDSLEFGKFKLYISRYMTEPSKLVLAEASHTESVLDIIFNEFLEKMQNQYIGPYFSILKLYFNNGTTYTPTDKEKTRVTNSYHICFTEFITSLQENMSFIPEVQHSEIKEINSIIEAHNKFKTFYSLHDKLPAKNDKNNQVKI